MFITELTTTTNEGLTVARARLLMCGGKDVPNLRRVQPNDESNKIEIEKLADGVDQQQLFLNTLIVSTCLCYHHPLLHCVAFQ